MMRFKISVVRIDVRPDYDRLHAETGALIGSGEVFYLLSMQLLLGFANTDMIRYYGIASVELSRAVTFGCPGLW